MKWTRSDTANGVFHYIVIVIVVITIISCSRAFKYSRHNHSQTTNSSSSHTDQFRSTPHTHRGGRARECSERRNMNGSTATTSSTIHDDYDIILVFRLFAPYNLVWLSFFFDYCTFFLFSFFPSTLFAPLFHWFTAEPRVLVMRRDAQFFFLSRLSSSISCWRAARERKR